MRVRRPGALPPSARPLGGLPRGGGGGASRRAPRAGGRDRPRGRARAPRVAPRPRRRRRGRDDRRGAGAVGRAGPGARRARGRRRVPRARRGADARAGAPRAARAGGGAGQAPRGRAGRGDAAARDAEAGPLDELARARVDVLRAQIAFAESRGRDAPALLLRAARRLEPLDVLAARDTYLDALAAATVAGRLSGDCPPAVVARAALAAPPPPEPPRASDLLLDGMALLATEGYPAAAPTLQRALGAFRDDDLPVDVALRWLWFAAHAALDVWDDESWELLATRHVALARQTGALTVLPAALNTRAGVHLGLGELDEAAARSTRCRAMSDATGGPGAAFVELALAGLRGSEARWRGWPSRPSGMRRAAARASRSTSALLVAGGARQRPRPLRRRRWRRPGRPRSTRTRCGPPRTGPSS